jgi:hypothetical protein
VCHASWVDAGSFYHSSCNGCQTCHGHGQSWNGADWEDFDNDTPCDEEFSGTSTASVPYQTQFNQASPAHEEESGQSCSVCHESHN